MCAKEDIINLLFEEDVVKDAGKGEGSRALNGQ